jgi:hypothetical protein
METYVMELSAHTEQTNKSAIVYRHRRLWRGLIVLIGVLGPVISLWAPIWLAPPYVHDTPWIYVPVLFAWLIVFVILSITHRLKTSSRGVSLIALVAVIEALLLVGFTVWWSLISFKCAPATLTDGMAHYDCQLIIQSIVPATDYSGNAEQGWHFQGLANSPLVGLISNANH